MIFTVFFVIVDIFLNAGVREFKRLDNTLKSPITQHIGSSISGLSIIRTFDKEKLFINRCEGTIRGMEEGVRSRDKMESVCGWWIYE